jgi:hypothetical protein
VVICLPFQFTICGAHSRYETSDFTRILDSRTGLHATADVYRRWAHHVNGIGHVFGVQASGEDNLSR